MAGYSEVIQTMGAMIIFSLILLSANRMIQRNTHMQIEGELEQEVVAVAQDIIEEGRTKEFDENSQGAAPPANIPGDFTGSSNLGGDFSADPTIDDDKDHDGTVERDEFDDFDDFNGWTEHITTENGEFDIETQVYYVTPDTYDSTGTRTTFKKMRVYITSKYLTKDNSNDRTKYYLEFIRNYYAD
ncbi:MAG: hypothetical protein PVI44_12895 [Balneolaceae bacterium]|jgi:hypothetical protein